MQHIPLIATALAGICIGLLILRSRWTRLHRSTHVAIVTGALIAIALFIASYATHWTTASDRLNSAIYWAAITAYLLLLTIHSLTRPRWLTSITAVILALPILASSLFLPLGNIFSPAPRRTIPLGDNLYASWQPFTELGPSSSGVDVEVSYRPRLLPFLQHARLGGRFYNQRCHAAATELLLQPDRRTVFVHCPAWPGSPETMPGELLPLH